MQCSFLDCHLCETKRDVVAVRGYVVAHQSFVHRFLILGLVLLRECFPDGGRKRYQTGGDRAEEARNAGLATLVGFT